MPIFDKTTGESDEWYTPPAIFEDFGVVFDLDPCSPGSSHWVPARRIFTKEDDGLSQSWEDNFVFMNPPFGGRNGHVPWLRKFFLHGNGIGLCRAYTSSGWFHDVFLPNVDFIMFPKGKTEFIPAEPKPKKTNPGHGVVFFSMGSRGREILSRTKLGFCFDVKAQRDPYGLEDFLG